MPINSHYVPKFILKKFGEKICVFNVKTGEYRENLKLNKVFSKENFYSEEIEKKLNKKIESHFSNLFIDKLSSNDEELRLTRKDVFLIKKFLLISIIRSIDAQRYMEIEKNYYKILNEYNKNFCEKNKIEYKEIKPPFIEKEYPNESSFDYWMRTLDVILDTNGNPNEILKHPEKTYGAYRWSMVINEGFLAFWEASGDEEFVITDIGMTSENEIGWDEKKQQNPKKMNFLMELLFEESNYDNQTKIYSKIRSLEFLHENFMMFPLSKKRIIVLVNPFFKFRWEMNDKYKMISLKELTLIPNEILFFPNGTEYDLSNKEKNLFERLTDVFIYKVNKLTLAETRYCNMLFLDRISNYVGFSNLKNVANSFKDYSLVLQRNNYDTIYDEILKKGL